MKREDASRNALVHVFEAVSGEKLVVISDEELLEISKSFCSAGISLGLWVKRYVLKKEKRYRKDLPEHLINFVVTSNPDIFINILKGDSEETPFRIKLISLQTRKRVRLGHCPGIVMSTLEKGALALSPEDYRKMRKDAESLLFISRDVVEVRVASDEGTDVHFSVKDREFFTDVKIDWKTFKWMNLPVGEVIVGPVETSLNGRIVCTTAVGGVGLLKESVEILAKNGRVVDIKCNDKSTLKKVKDALATDKWASYVGEFAIGLNPKARFQDSFLETEKMAETSHIAFGNNSDYPGGMNMSANHMDFLIMKPDVTFIYKDGREEKITKKGKIAWR